MASLAPGCPNASVRRDCSPFQCLTLLLPGNCAPTSCLCPEPMLHPFSARVGPPLATPTCCAGDPLRPCHHHPTLPAPLSSSARSLCSPRACTMPKQLQQTVLAGWVTLRHLDLLLKHSDKTLATYVRNNWNTCNMCLKHLETLEKIHYKHM
jgi:hypothetical protein